MVKPSNVIAQMMNVPPSRPHGSSLAAKPMREPHPKAPGRDKLGRVMPMMVGKPAIPVAPTPPGKNAPMAKVAMMKAAGKAPSMNVPPQPLPQPPSIDVGGVPSNRPVY